MESLSNNISYARCLFIGFLLIAVSSFSQVHAAVKIEHKAVKKTKSGQRIDLSAEFKDRADGVKKAFAYFNSDLDAKWHRVVMAGKGKDFKGQLPAPDVHTSTVNYRFLVVNGRNEIRTGDIHSIRVKKDKKAQKRLERKEPTDIKIDVSEIEDARDLVESVNRAKTSSSDLAKANNKSKTPKPESRLRVESEYQPNIDSLRGFTDYLNLHYVADAYGVAAGIVPAAQSVASATGLSASGSAGTYAGAAAASAGGIGGGVILGGLVLAGGAAAAGGISSSDDEDSQIADGRYRINTFSFNCGGRDVTRGLFSATVTVSSGQVVVDFSGSLFGIIRLNGTTNGSRFSASANIQGSTVSFDGSINGSTPSGSITGNIVDSRGASTSCSGSF